MLVGLRKFRDAFWKRERMLSFPLARDDAHT